MGRNLYSHGQPTEPRQNVEFTSTPPKPRRHKNGTQTKYEKILHAYKGTEKDFLKEVALKYISKALPCAHADYVGAPNPDLDKNSTKPRYEQFYTN